MLTGITFIYIRQIAYKAEIFKGYQQRAEEEHRLEIGERRTEPQSELWGVDEYFKKLRADD